MTGPTVCRFAPFLPSQALIVPCRLPRRRWASVCHAVLVWTPEREAGLRAGAFSWLAARTHDGVNSITSEEIHDFTFDGEPFALMDRQRGIRKPAGFALRYPSEPCGDRRAREDLMTMRCGPTDS